MFAPPRVPSSSEVLQAPFAFDPDSQANISTYHLRRLSGQNLPAPVPIDDEEVTAYHVDLLTNRILSKRDTVIVVDGEPGEGKSTYSIGLAARVKNALSVELGKTSQFDPDQHIVWRESDLIHQIHVNTRDDPQVIVSDEGILAGMQARAGTYDASSMLDQVLGVSRVKGLTVFVLAPSVWGLASFVRNRRAKFYHHVETRGLTTVSALKGRISWTPPRELPFDKMKRPWCKVHWQSLEDDPIWAKYEIRKIAEVDAMLAASELRAIQIEEKAGLRLPVWAEAAGYRSLHTSRFKRAPGETPVEANRRKNRLAYREKVRVKSLAGLEAATRGEASEAT